MGEMPRGELVIAVTGRANRAPAGAGSKQVQWKLERASKCFGGNWKLYPFWFDPVQLCRKAKELAEHWQRKVLHFQRIGCLSREWGVKQVSESTSGSRQWSSMSMDLSKSIFLSQLAQNREVKASVFLLARSYVRPAPTPPPGRSP